MNEEELKTLDVLFWQSPFSVDHSWDQPEMPWMYLGPDFKTRMKIVKDAKDYNKIYVITGALNAIREYVPLSKFLADHFGKTREHFHEDTLTECIVSISKLLKNKSFKGKTGLYRFSCGENQWGITKLNQTK